MKQMILVIILVAAVVLPARSQNKVITCQTYYTPGGDVAAAINNCINMGLSGQTGIADARSIGASQASTPIIITQGVQLLLPAGVITQSNTFTPANSPLIQINNSGMNQIEVDIDGIQSTILLSNTGSVGISITGPTGSNTTVKLSNLLINTAPLVTKTAGAAIDYEAAGTLRISDTVVAQQYNGIIVGGEASNVRISRLDLSNTISDGIIQNAVGTDFQYRDIVSNNSPSSSGAGFHWINGNSVFMADADFVNFTNGVLVQPGMGQYAQFGFFAGVLADTSSDSGWAFPSASGTVSAIQCTDCWAAASVGYGVYLNNSGLSQFRWSGGKVLTNATGGSGGGFGILAGRDIWVGAGTVLSGNGGLGGIVASANLGRWSVVGVRSGEAGQPSALYINGGTYNNVIITDNDFTCNTSLPSLATAGSNTVYSNNIVSSTGADPTCP